MNERKLARIAAAERARAERRAKETNDLSVAFLRAQSIYLIFLDEYAALRSEAGGRGRVPPIPLDRFEPSRATRASTMMLFYYASLNVVVEGWRDPQQAEPRLTDPAIDALLESEYVDTLAGFRNAILHPNPLLDRRVLKLHASHHKLKAWTEELSKEFQRFFRSWREAIGFPSQQVSTP